MRKLSACVFVIPLLCCALPARAIDWPVFFLSYDGAVGVEETEDEEAIEPSSYRHTATLRIKEDVVSALTLNLYTVLSRKQYLLQKGSYSYAYVNPDVAWDITDAVKWYTSFRSKWTVYDEVDSLGVSKDMTGLLAKTTFTFKLLEALKIIPSFEGVFDLYENEQKTRQTYTLGVSLDADLGGVALGANYRGVYRSPLGLESTVSSRLNHEFGMDFRWDPNE